jgi:hypothetical protein
VQSQGNAQAFVIGAKDHSLAAANQATDVPWLQLHNVAGNLATTIYRIYTRGGQAPTSCTPGSADITVKYTSQYCMHTPPRSIVRMLTWATRALQVVMSDKRPYLSFFDTQRAFIPSTQRASRFEAMRRDGTGLQYTRMAVRIPCSACSTVCISLLYLPIELSETASF